MILNALLIFIGSLLGILIVILPTLILIKLFKLRPVILKQEEGYVIRLYTFCRLIPVNKYLNEYGKVVRTSRPEGSTYILRDSKQVEKVLHYYLPPPKPPAPKRVRVSLQEIKTEELLDD